MPLISYSDALASVLDYCDRELPIETVPLVLALGRVLARPVVAAENIPAHPNSAMDGYAIRAADTAGATEAAPARLKVIGESAAGSVFEGIVGAGEATRIMTGGLIPEGADAVIEIEATTETNATVEIRREAAVGKSIRKIGEDIAAGTEAIGAGGRITPGDIGVLASLGVVNVPVRVKPKVGILSTGSEIVEAFRTPAAGQVRNSTLPALYAACAEAGAEPIDLGIVGDDRDELEERLEEGLRYDILITTGGVSAGAYDFVQEILPALGVEVQFHKVNIRPGKPVLFGTFGEAAHRTLVFGLPGNPVSTLVTFRQFVAPAIARLLRRTGPPLRLKARLASPLPAVGDGRRHFVRAIVSDNEHGDLIVTTTGTQSSGAMSSMSRANCLIIISEAAGAPAAGSMVDVELL
ncbi:MAG: Molybdopterin biosynthesis enzyme MoeA [Chlorobi bacterium]|nr:Molybdopterin biosynthesis enzyme MoeA [Chlorobiota bacterium]